MLEQIEFYQPVISVAVEPRTHADQEKLTDVLDKFLAEDPTLRVRVDEDTGQTILSGMGELHLEIITSRMQREFNTAVNVGKPQVVYRETIKAAAVGQGLFDREVAGQKHFAGVTRELKPLPRGSDNRFSSRLEAEQLPPDQLTAVEKGVRESLESGTLMGYPVVDVAAELAEVQTKENLGSALGFTVAAAMACKDALAKAVPFLLDPIMRVEVYVPESFMGDVIGDLSARSGKIESVQHRSGAQVITATVPLAQMFGYSTSLRSATQGRGTFSMHFSHFDRAH
jgi:elongation factor G